MDKHTANDVVITTAYGVGPEYVSTFLRTFRAVNKRARIILLVSGLNRLQAIANDFDAELRMVQWLPRCIPSITLRRKRQRVRLTEVLSRTNSVCPKLSSIYPESLIQALVPFPVARLFHIRQVMACESMGQVLLSDSRDVLFQSDPFDRSVELEFAQESNVFGQCPFNDKWIRVAFGDTVLDALRGRAVFCSGTIFGRHEQVLKHITRMCRAVRELRSWRCFGQDQGIHNFIIHTEMSPSEYQVSTNSNGRIATVGTRPDTPLKDGYVVDMNGEPFPIVHQYDRLMSIENLRALNGIVTNTARF